MIHVERALQFVRDQGSAFDQARLQQFLGDARDPEFALPHILPHQNQDGGWARGLEPDYPGPLSTISSSTQALRLLGELGLNTHPVFLRTVSFITIMQRSDGAWDEDMALYAHKPARRLLPTRRWTVWASTVDALAALIRAGFADSREVDWGRKFLSVDEDLVEEIWGQGIWYPAVGLVIFGSALEPRTWEYNRCQQILTAWIQSGEGVDGDLAVLADALLATGLTKATGPFEDARKRIEAAQQPDGGWLAPARWTRADATLVTLRYLKEVGAVQLP